MYAAKAGSMHVWSNVLSCDDITAATHLLNDTLAGISNECFPRIKVKVSSWEPPPSPYMTTMVKHLCTIRNKNFDLQARIYELILNNQVWAVRNVNSKHGTGTKGWWNTVNKIVTRESKAQNISSVNNPEDISLLS